MGASRIGQYAKGGPRPTRPNYSTIAAISAQRESDARNQLVRNALSELTLICSWSSGAAEGIFKWGGKSMNIYSVGVVDSGRARENEPLVE